MGPESWYVELNRNSGALKVDLANHNYAKNRGTEAGLSDIWDDKDTLILGQVLCPFSPYPCTFAMAFW